MTLPKILSLFITLSIFGCASSGRNPSSSPMPIAQQSELDRAPPTFRYREAKAIFIDMQTVNSTITLQPQKREAEVTSKISFQTAESGYPLLNLPVQARVSSISLDGKILDAKKFSIASPDSTVDWSVRAIPEITEPGAHTLSLSYYLGDENPKVLLFDPAKNTVDFFPIMDDFFKQGAKNNQGYLETLFPTNLQFDTYEFHLQIAVLSPVIHTVKANGFVKEEGKNKFSVLFPSHFTTNSFFVHTLPVSELEEGINDFHYSYRSIDGRKIPVEVYCDKVIEYCGTLYKDVESSLRAIEEKIGPYPYESLLYRNSYRFHSMEYAGAFTAGFDAIRHEAGHQWFGRCLKPNAGSDGWFDEAAATWLEQFYRDQRPDLSDQYESPVDMTKTRGYGTHSTAMGYGGVTLFKKLDKLFENTGGVAPVLKKLFQAFAFKTMTTQEFHDFLRAQPEWNEQAETLLQFFVYGKRKVSAP